MRGFDHDCRPLADVERRHAKRAVRRRVRDRKRERQPRERSGEPQRPAARSERPQHAECRCDKRETIWLRQTPEHPCGARQVGKRVEHWDEHACAARYANTSSGAGSKTATRTDGVTRKLIQGIANALASGPSSGIWENQYAVSGASPSVMAYCTRALDAIPRPIRRAESKPRQQANADSPDHVAEPVANVAAWLAFVHRLDHWIRRVRRRTAFICVRRRELLRESDRRLAPARRNREQDGGHGTKRQPESRCRHRPWIGQQHQPQRPRKHQRRRGPAPAEHRERDEARASTSIVARGR